MGVHHRKLQQAQLQERMYRDERHTTAILVVQTHMMMMDTAVNCSDVTLDAFVVVMMMMMAFVVVVMEAVVMEVVVMMAFVVEYDDIVVEIENTRDVVMTVVVVVVVQSNRWGQIVVASYPMMEKMVVECGLVEVDIFCLGHPMASLRDCSQDHLNQANRIFEMPATELEFVFFETVSCDALYHDSICRL